MTVNLPPAVEAVIFAEAQRRGTTAENVVVAVLSERFPTEQNPNVSREAWDEWLRKASVDAGVVPPRSAMTSDELYD